VGKIDMQIMNLGPGAQNGAEWMSLQVQLHVALGRIDQLAGLRDDFLAFSFPGQTNDIGLHLDGVAGESTTPEIRELLSAGDRLGPVADHLDQHAELGGNGVTSRRILCHAATLEGTSEQAQRIARAVTDRLVASLMRAGDIAAIEVQWEAFLFGVEILAQKYEVHEVVEDRVRRKIVPRGPGELDLATKTVIALFFRCMTLFKKGDIATEQLRQLGHAVPEAFSRQASAAEATGQTQDESEDVRDPYVPVTRLIEPDHQVEPLTLLRLHAEAGNLREVSTAIDDLTEAAGLTAGADSRHADTRAAPVARQIVLSVLVADLDGLEGDQSTDLFVAVMQFDHVFRGTIHAVLDGFRGLLAVSTGTENGKRYADLYVEAVTMFKASAAVDYGEALQYLETLGYETYGLIDEPQAGAGDTAPTTAGQGPKKKSKKKPKKKKKAAKPEDLDAPTVMNPDGETSP